MQDLKMKKIVDTTRNNSEEDDDAGTSGDIRLLIEPLAKSELVDLLSELGSKHPSIREEIKSFASAIRAHRDLASNTNSTTSSSERLAVSNSADKVLIETLSGATVTDVPQKKLLIGNLSPQVTREMLLNYFEKHGDIKKASIVYQYHKNLNASCRYGVVTYKTIEAAKRAKADLDQKTFEGNTITVYYFDFDSHKSRVAPMPSPYPGLLPTPFPYPGLLPTPSPYPGLLPTPSADLSLLPKPSPYQTYGQGPSPPYISYYYPNQ